MPHKEIKTSHSKEHEHGIGSSILGEADVVGHEGQRKGTGEGDRKGKRSCEEIDHGDGEDSEDQRNDSKVSFWLGERVELMGENKKEGRMKISRFLFIKFYLAFEVISGVIEGMDFVHPERLLVKGIDPQGKTDEKA